ncbi:cation diffusion facilitator family transporter [Marinobacterium arenosum]|uniref:cation diffusion facilitator family transporter n=1 Tax=Marinobacterium arenosum TaxID=2862496 RepID=UPI001C942980|nr:cation diffusion facilitator family transporter [Marinobacterium arenosum]MBY4677801.1 cation diffusion facilitator family transporter [Marinobacterium arenosum]
MTETEQQHRAAIRITLIGSLIDTLLGISKIAFGMLSHSAALVADGIHSLSDLATDALVLVMLRISAQDPDKDHPWGHGRFETVGTVFLGSALIAVAGAMAYESLQNLLQVSSLKIPEWPALVVAAVSIVAKEGIYRYSLQIANQVNSDLLRANAWHSRTDALSSIVVFVGVAGAMSGLPWLDSVAAIAVALFVARIGWRFAWQSLLELVDTALPDEQLKPLQACVMSIDGIRNVHSFKSRRVGNQSVLEMHIQVAPYLSASEGHFLGDRAVCKLHEQFEDIGHVIYHIDTYDDELEQVCHSRPLRPQIEAQLAPLLVELPLGLQLKRLDLHYHHQQIDLELCFLWTEYQHPSPEQLACQVREQLGNPAWLHRVQISFGADG